RWATGICGSRAWWAGGICTFAIDDPAYPAWPPSRVSALRGVRRTSPGERSIRTRLEHCATPRATRPKLSTTPRRRRTTRLQRVVNKASRDEHLAVVPKHVGSIRAALEAER